MFLLKKIFLWILFGGLVLFGGYAVQSDSSALQGMGFMGVLLAFVVLYIIYKIMWTFMSFGMVFLVVGGVIFFILHSLGIIGSDGGTISESLSELTDISALENQPEEQYTVNETAENNGLIRSFENLFAKKKTEHAPEKVEFNPYNYPAVSGKVSVVTGSILRLKSLNIRLFGIDAPDTDQTCADRLGRAYGCGKKALTFLQDFIAGRKVTCHILGKIVNNNATGACFVGDSDLSAMVAEAGWALAYTKNTDVYVPYEKEARINKRGLWEGRFYRPQDWRKLQSRKFEVEIETKDIGGKSWFDGWF